MFKVFGYLLPILTFLMVPYLYYVYQINIYGHQNAPAGFEFP